MAELVDDIESYIRKCSVVASEDKPLRSFILIG